VTFDSDKLALDGGRYALSRMLDQILNPLALEIAVLVNQRPSEPGQGESGKQRAGDERPDQS
jgi:hypothetical protein